MTAVSAGKFQSIGGITPPATSVSVFTHATTTLASLFTDVATGTALANPIVSDSNGDISFWAIPATYDLSWVEGDLAQLVTVSIHEAGGGNITWTPGVPACAGNIGDLAVNKAGAAGTKTNVYFCTVAGAAGSATWVGIA